MHHQNLGLFSLRCGEDELSIQNLFVERAPGQAGDLMFYEKAAGAKASGSLIGPWQGTHGWYWQNKSGAPVTVRVRLAGFYELIPGQSGQAVKE